MDEEIKEIKNDIKSNSFSLNDFSTIESTIEITDKYIVDNFIVQEDNLDVSYEEDKIKINLLNDQDIYKLKFVPKNTCEKVMVWTSNNIELLNMNAVCESVHEVNVNYLGEKKTPDNEQIANKVPVNENNGTSEFTPKDEEVIEVNVPNTSKYSYSFLVGLLLLGNIYYVFKK